jgi:hypothetical protein
LYTKWLFHTTPNDINLIGGELMDEPTSDGLVTHIQHRINTTYANAIFSSQTDKTIAMMQPIMIFH